MVCTNKQCTKPSLLHARCFDKLEKHLLKALAASPMGRKWTEAQLETNVWNGRGVDVLYKYSRCSCGGTLSKLRGVLFQSTERKKQAFCDLIQ